MKKILIKIFTIIFSIIMCLSILGCGDGFNCEGCGNANIGIGGYSFYYVHIFSEKNTDACFRIKSWKDDEVGIEVCLEDNNVLFISEGKYLLAKDYCPICGKK